MKRLFTALRLARCLLLALAWAGSARAHDPFDGNINAFVYANKVEVRVTLGYDAARTFFRASGLPPMEAARMTRPAEDGQPLRLPVALAAQLLALEAGGRQIPASAFLVAPGDVEVNLLVIFPRPPGAGARLRAAYFDTIADMRAGPVTIAGPDRRVLATALVSKDSPVVALPFGAAAGAQAQAQASEGAGAAGFFRLGVEHILTGFDHLLFLCALLVGALRLRAMLGIVTAFTLGHSITLALAALDVVALAPAIVEPLIAASIVAACLANLLRRDGARSRYWMAGGFGLVHGFGFAGALREAAQAASGADLLGPLAAFNAGVETGQLLVAALLVPLLVLARRGDWFARHGGAALSVAIGAVSGFWLLQRLPLA